jgi:diadenosine tetraphosphate (Ap4A) HIT family hydrolase
VPDAEAAFREKFRLDDLTIHENDDWTLSVRPKQPVLGALVISTRHGALDFAQLPAASGATMLTLIGRAEAAARDGFGAVRMNALCLMMQDPLFHFHLLPRYAAPLDLRGRQWADAGWPGPPDLTVSLTDDDADLREVARRYAADTWR